MKHLRDPFPSTPATFHARVEQTFDMLEERNVRNMKTNKKLTAMLVAAIMVLLSIGAVAAVIGGSQLRQELNDSGASDVASRVQDVHIADTTNGFGITIDEAIWEDNDLYISCTLSVPEDGNTYLAGLMQPTINGDYVNAKQWLYLNDANSPLAIALGGDYPATYTVVLPLEADSRELDLKDMNLRVHAAFFSTNRPLEYLPNFYDEDGMQNDPDQRYARDDRDMFYNADTLYYWEMENGTPMIDIYRFPEVYDTKRWSQEGEESGFIELTRDEYGDVYTRLTPAGLESTGIATLLNERSVDLKLDKSMVSHNLYNALAENTFRCEDMSIVIEDFRMTHFKLSAKIWQVPDEPLPESDSEIDFDRFIGLLFAVNGDPVGGYWGNIETRADGVRAYCEDYSCMQYITLGSLESLQLVTTRWDEEKQEHFVDTVIADLMPLLDASIAEAEATELAKHEAAGSWKPGDADIPVFVFENDAFYHIDVQCSDMTDASECPISDAAAAGKSPCPLCAGGKSEPAEWEEGVDIMMLYTDD